MAIDGQLTNLTSTNRNKAHMRCGQLFVFESSLKETNSYPTSLLFVIMVASAAKLPLGMVSRSSLALSLAEEMDWNTIDLGSRKVSPELLFVAHFAQQSKGAAIKSSSKSVVTCLQRVANSLQMTWCQGAWVFSSDCISFSN